MTIIVSRMTVGFGRCISVEALDGPLRYLSAVWSFEPQDECHTQLLISVNYEFSNPVLAAVASRVFANRSMHGPSRGLRESITLQNLNVIRPLQRGWVRQVLLTHATADFRDRGKLPRSKKPDKSIEQFAHVVDAVTQQR
jgi:hypothetical protein